MQPAYLTVQVSMPCRACSQGQGLAQAALLCWHVLVAALASCCFARARRHVPHLTGR